MKVLNVIHFPIFGGPHNETLRLHGPLLKRGIELVVALPDEPGSAAQRLREGGIEVVQVPLQRVRATPDPKTQFRFLNNFGKDVDTLRQVIKDHAVDVVQLGGLVNPHAAIAARRAGIPVVWQIVDTRPPLWMRHALGRLVERLADVVLFTGRALIDAHFTRPPKVESLVYYPPVNIELFRPSASLRESTRRGWDIPSEARVIGTVANLTPMKGLEFGIRAADRVFRQMADTRYVIVGSSHSTHRRYETQLNQEKDATCDPDRILFVGETNEIEQIYPALDIMLITSKSEGTPTTALEAMSCGVPVVATDISAIHEVIEEGSTGHLVPPGDVATISQALTALLKDDDRRLKMGIVAREQAEARFSAEICADTFEKAYMAAQRNAGPRVATTQMKNMRLPLANPPTPIPIEILACPDCHGTLESQIDSLNCVQCAASYPIVDGIPILLPHRGSAVEDIGAVQADFYDEQVDEEFEITRPFGTPELYSWFFQQKFIRSVQGIEHMVPGCTAISVCGGSGLDAEYLARAGARVLVSDISLGAMKRARERARRGNLSVFPIVADVQKLPLRSRAVDLAYVHDGLHHIVDPMVGLREMSRVAKRALSLTEPSVAAATTLAVKLGISVQVEEAGNVVARMDLSDIGDKLWDEGFEVVARQRYAMFYRHEPGAPMRVLSRRPALSATKSMWLLGNSMIGRFGNKLSVTAVRRGSTS